MFSFTDEDEFRNLVVWLEDQKIRWYKIEDRGQLRDVKSSEWLKTFAKVACCKVKILLTLLMGYFIAQYISQHFPRRRISWVIVTILKYLYFKKMKLSFCY